MSDYGYGVDAMQALIAALGGIRFRLDSAGRSFTFLGSDYLGFDRSIPFWGDAAATRRIERLVDREVLRYVRELKRKHEARSRTAHAAAQDRPTARGRISNPRTGRGAHLHRPRS
jgi:hypothetical protein